MPALDTAFDLQPTRRDPSRPCTPAAAPEGVDATRLPLPAGIDTARAGRSASRTLATALEVAGFACHSVGTRLERRGRAVARALEPHPADDWTAGSGATVPLDRNGAAHWALAHVTAAPAVASNCAYFVSESLRLGGGLPMTERWIPGTTAGRVRRWQRIAAHPAYGCVGDFVIEMQRVGYGRLIGTDTMLAAPPGAAVGDVVVYNWDGRGGYQHLALVTAFDDTGLMRVTQHTPSQRNRPWNRYGDGRWIQSASLLRFATDSPAERLPRT